MQAAVYHPETVCAIFKFIKRKLVEPRIMKQILMQTIAFYKNVLTIKIILDFLIKQSEILEGRDVEQITGIFLY